MGPVGCSQYQYTASILSPASMGMYAAAVVPGSLQARKGESCSKTGLMETQGRWTSQGWPSWVSRSLSGSYLRETFGLGWVKVENRGQCW